jgi:hypothetical protein
MLGSSIRNLLELPLDVSRPHRDQETDAILDALDAGYMSGATRLKTGKNYHTDL